MRVFLDMDCVLANFVEGMARLWGATREELERLQPPGQYDYRHALDRYIVERTDIPPECVPLSLEDFWRPIHEAPGFWRNLEPLPWASELFRIALAAAGGGRSAEDPDYHDWGDLYVVTSPSRCPGCIREKEDWLLHHFGLPHDRMIPTPHKELLAVYRTDPANPRPYRSALLIDDYDANVDKFRAAGGKAILVPSHHGSLHEHKADPLGHVREALSLLEKERA